MSPPAEDRQDTSDPPADELKEHLRHWWREVLAGGIAIAIACWDMWHFGSAGGFTSSLDELLLVTGIALVAGVRNLFGADRKQGNGRPPPLPPEQSA